MSPENQLEIHEERNGQRETAQNDPVLDGGHFHLGPAASNVRSNSDAVGVLQVRPKRAVAMDDADFVLRLVAGVQVVGQQDGEPQRGLLVSRVQLWNQNGIFFFVFVCHLCEPKQTEIVLYLI